MSEKTPNASTNMTEGDEVAELRRLLRRRLIEALQEANPKASMMAVAAKFLAEHDEIAPPSEQLPDRHDLPFPVYDPDPGPERHDLPFPVRKEAPRWPPLSLPFHDDDDTTAR
jgi:hypothetical protein